MIVNIKEQKPKNNKQGEVVYLTSPVESRTREQLYISVREKEGRLYPDEVLQYLPEIPARHPLSREWQMRAASLRRLLKYLWAIKKPLQILDLGCGNGWMSRHLAENSTNRVFALDMNEAELAQGARVFKDYPNLTFYYGDIFQDIFPEQRFDMILLASSVQYFPDIKRLVLCLNELLSGNGEIHILDSPFYTAENVEAARERTRTYYRKIGYPEMASKYYHHLLSDITTFNPEMLYNPGSIPRRIRKKISGLKSDSPFPWVKIKKLEL